MDEYGTTQIELLPTDPAHNVFPFELRTPSDSIFISANTENERDKWISSLHSNIICGDIGNSILDEVMLVRADTLANAPSFACSKGVLLISTYGGVWLETTVASVQGGKGRRG